MFKHWKDMQPDLKVERWKSGWSFFPKKMNCLHVFWTSLFGKCQLLGLHYSGLQLSQCYWSLEMKSSHSSRHSSFSPWMYYKPWIPDTRWCLLSSMRTARLLILSCLWPGWVMWTNPETQHRAHTQRWPYSDFSGLWNKFCKDYTPMVNSNNGAC